MFGAGAEVSHSYFKTLVGEGQWVSGPGAEKQEVSAVGKEEEHAFALDSKPVLEQHTFELDARLEAAGPSAACSRMFSEAVVEQHAFELDSKPVLEQHAFELVARLEVAGPSGACFRMRSEPVVEQHAFELDARLEVVGAFGACFRMLSTLVEEQHASGLAFVRHFAGDSSVACVTQHEGNLIFSISAQRHSARSRAILHRPRECCMSMPLVD